MTAFSQKTATIAASVLSVLAFLQLVVVFIVLVRHPSGPGIATNPVSEKSGTTQNSKGTISKTGETSTHPSATTGASETLSPENTTTPAGDLAMMPSEVDILVKRATDIRDKGDMSGTLASLREAQKLFPDDPKIVAEFAATYEQMGLVDKALAQWKRVMDAGDKAGDLYGVAAEKVRLGVMPRESSSSRDEEGLQVGSTLGFVDLQKTYDTSNPDVEAVNLRMGIKSRQNAAINASEVNIQVKFYDLIDNTEVQPTDPRHTRVTSEWLTLPADWKEDGVEVLKVRYEQKPPAPGEKPATERKYLGYVVSVYYENELQDVLAEPVKLLQNYPPPVSLQKEIPQ